uniref:Uncharacterized protein n=1 Tax=Romanomermis culicivorax TaxID=13658 RepID=A0A915KVF1_ROMCU
MKKYEKNENKRKRAKSESQKAAPLFSANKKSGTARYCAVSTGTGLILYCLGRRYGYLGHNFEAFYESKNEWNKPIL